MARITLVRVSTQHIRSQVRQQTLPKGTDTLISSVTEDFDKSPTIRYMDKTNTQTNGNTTGSANPFVSNEQVNEKIKSVLMSAIDKISEFELHYK